MKKITLSLIALMIYTLGFSQLSGGTYTVGTGGTYTSLKAACDAANAGITGDVTFQIISDLTESACIGIVNTSTFKIIITPDGVGKKIIFDVNAANAAGPNGSIVIGANSGLTWADLVPSQNVFIDGANLLTIETNSNTDFQHSPIVILDGSRNISITNCTLTMNGLRKNGTSTEYNPEPCILIKGITDKTNAVPSNITILGNKISFTPSATGTRAIGIDSRNMAGTTQAVPATRGSEILIKDNKITTRRQGIDLQFVDNPVVDGNEIHLFQTLNSFTNYGISYTTSINAGVNTGTITIKNNKILELVTSAVTASTETIGIAAKSGGGTWEIYNNFITGFGYNGATGGKPRIQGIGLFTNNTKVYHNTIVMNQLTGANVPTTDGDASNNNASTYAAITFGNWNSGCVIQNNILISREDRCKNMLIRSSGSSISFTSNYNVLHLPASPVNARYNADFSDFALYQASGKDANSKNVDVTFAAESTGDLHLAGASIQNSDLSVASIATVTTDIDGTTRQNPTYVGAHQSVLPFITTALDGNNANNLSKIIRTSTGIRVELAGEASIALYSVNGALIESKRFNGTYTRDLTSGIYIIKINGDASKFVL